MNAGQIFTLATYGFVALITAAIGIHQLRSEKPATFYSGEKPLKPEQLTSVEDWNRGHGRMWLCYALVILLSALPFAFDMRTWAALACLILGVILPIPIMVILHERMLKKYKRSENAPEKTDNGL